MPAEIVLRTPTEEEYPRFIAPLSIAFNRRMSEAEIDADRRTVERDRFVGALDGDAVVGCGGAYTFRMTVPGGEVGAAGITSVGVLPTHRRRGILRKMMGWWFDQARARHEPVAILWASEAAIYQRFGFGPATQQTFLEAPTDKIRFLRPVEPPGQIRIVEPDEAFRLFPPIYDALVSTVPGAVNRSPARWSEEQLADTEWSRHDNGDKVLAVHEQDGAPTGYVIYRQRPEWDFSGPKSVLTVIEVAAVDPISEAAIWQWLFSIDLIGTVRVWRGPAPHPLHLLVTEPRRLSTTLNDGLWMRIIDLPAALEARSYEVTDEFQPSNAGRWMVSMEAGGSRPGRAQVRPAEPRVDADIALDIADVAAVYLGAFRFADLAGVGRVIECRPDGLARADALFSHPGRPNTATVF